MKSSDTKPEHGDIEQYTWVFQDRKAVLYITIKEPLLMFT